MRSIGSSIRFCCLISASCTSSFYSRCISSALLVIDYILTCSICPMSDCAERWSSSGSWASAVNANSWKTSDRISIRCMSNVRDIKKIYSRCFSYGNVEAASHSFSSLAWSTEDFEESDPHISAIPRPELGDTKEVNS